MAQITISTVVVVIGSTTVVAVIATAIAIVAADRQNEYLGFGPRAHSDGSFAKPFLIHSLDSRKVSCNEPRTTEYASVLPHRGL